MKRSPFFLSALSVSFVANVALAQEEEAAQEAAPLPAVATAPAPAREEPAKKASEEEQKRQGFTMEIGLGASFMTRTDEVNRVEDDKFGLAPLSIGLGAWLSRDVAVTFRMSGTSLFQDRGGGTEQVVLGFYGTSLQYYVTDKVYLGGGVGLGLLAGLPLGLDFNRNRDAFVPRAGVAGSLRTGVAFFSNKRNQVSLTGEVVPLWLGDSGARPDVVGFAVGLGWQLM